MPQLPTLTVTDAQAQRMLAAYGSVDNYLEWLRSQIIEFVVSQEFIAAQKSFEQTVEQNKAQARNELSQ